MDLWILQEDSLTWKHVGQEKKKFFVINSIFWINYKVEDNIGTVVT